MSAMCECVWLYEMFGMHAALVAEPLSSENGEENLSAPFFSCNPEINLLCNEKFAFICLVTFTKQAIGKHGILIMQMLKVSK